MLKCWVEQHLKKLHRDRLVLGCFFGLGFAVFAGCVWKSLETSGKVWESENSDAKSGKIK